ncbi:hypothetical protein AX15_003702 [Amanita polypyramis BW_CC]|nr:hypothetical protein AX15_003702 [Amanita polypyramis BW_CC]
MTTEANRLTTLPLELLGEILVKTRSTRDILTVARCNRYLWKTLAAPSAAFLWKKTRQIALPESMPDPPSMLSEPAYASMMFDGGNCSFCGNYTREVYTSFALRLRLCAADRGKKFPSVRCEFTQLLRNKDPDGAIWERTPVIECRVSNFNSGDPWPPVYWPNTALWCRAEQRARVLAEYERGADEFQDTGNFEEFQRKHQDAIKKNKEWMEFCVMLSKWKDNYIDKFKTNKTINDDQARTIAISKGYELHRLMNVPSYTALHRLRNASLQRVSWQDYYAIEFKVDAELKAIEEKRKRSNQNASYRTVWKAIEKQFHTLRSDDPKLILPPFGTFRRLPTLSCLLSLASPDTSSSVKDIVKKNGIREVLIAELAKWENEARHQMAAVLEYSDWKSGNRTETHPVDRLTAWFLCRECMAQAVKYRRQIYPLTFAKACSHECLVAKGRSDPWDASTFVKDDKAIAAMKKVLQLAGKDESHSNMTWLGAPDVGRAMRCLTCRPFAILTAKDLVGHCHRHEDMEIEPLGDEGRLQPIRTYLMPKQGLAQTLMGRSGEESNLRDCGCRYCFYEVALRPRDAQVEALVARQPKMTVNGLRSHLKAKHGFEVLRDEDVFTFPKVAVSMIV